MLSDSLSGLILASFKGFTFIPLFSSTKLFRSIKGFTFTPFEFSDSLKGLTFKPFKLVNLAGLTPFCNLFLAILQSSLLWLNLPQCSQGVLPPNLVQLYIQVFHDVHNLLALKAVPY